MNQLREVRLAGTGFTLDEGGHVMVGGDAELLGKCGQRWRVADESAAEAFGGGFGGGVGKRRPRFQAALSPGGRLARVLRPRPPPGEMVRQPVEKPKVARTKER